MKPNNPMLSALRIADRKQWIDTVSSAFEAEQGYIERTARRLGIGTRTLVRWLAEDDELRKRRAIIAGKRES
jgi:ActR/RegA family two-component response regulator